MADNNEISDSKGESLMEKIADKLHGDDSSSPDSESAQKPASSPPTVKPKTTPSSSSMKDKIYRMFGREKPVHKVFGGGKRTYTLSLSLSPYARVLSQLIEATYITYVFVKHVLLRIHLLWLLGWFNNW